MNEASPSAVVRHFDLGDQRGEAEIDVCSWHEIQCHIGPTLDFTHAGVPTCLLKIAPDLAKVSAKPGFSNDPHMSVPDAVDGSHLAASQCAKLWHIRAERAYQ